MKSKTLVFAAMSTVIAACATTNADPLRTNQQVAMSTPAPVLNTVNIIDDRLQTTTILRNGQASVSGKLAVEGAGQKYTATQNREVWATLRNLTDYAQNVEARVTWFDGQNAPVDGPTSWSRIHIPQNGSEIYRSQSISPAAEAFFVEIRELN